MRWFDQQFDSIISQCHAVQHRCNIIEHENTELRQENCALREKIAKPKLEASSGEPTREETQTLWLPIDELPVSVRTYNCLRNANIRTLGDIISSDVGELRKAKNFGKKSLNELRSALLDLGFRIRFDNEEIAPAKPKCSYINGRRLVVDDQTG